SWHRCRHGRDCGSPARDEDQHMRADLEPVALLEQPLLDPLAVDEGAVEAALVLQHHPDRLDPNGGVAGGHGGAGEHDVVLVVAADPGDPPGQRIDLLLAQPRAPHELRMLGLLGRGQLVDGRRRIDDAGVADVLFVRMHGLLPPEGDSTLPAPPDEGRLTSMDHEQTPMEDAEAQLYRRIQELRARARGLAEEAQPASGEERPDEPQPAGDALSQAAEARPAMPDLRTILARAESHVEQLRTTAATLERRLPADVERAVERAMAQHGDERRLTELRHAMAALSRQIEQVNRDLLAERLGRVEDLELVVDLVSTGMAELRRDTATLAALVDRVGGGVDTVLDKLDQPLQVTVERPSHTGVRDLFTPTDAPTGPRPVD